MTNNYRRSWLSAANKTELEHSNFVLKLASCYKDLERLNRLVLNDKLRYGRTMSQRKLLVIAGFLFIASACSPLNASTVGEVIITSTAAAASSHVSPTASPHSPSAPIPIMFGPYFTLTRDANCYTGPGVGYDFVLILHAGESIAVIGRDQESNWWRLSPDTVVDCWVADQWGTLTGEAASIPITTSRYATKAVTPISPTQTKKNQVEEPTSVPLSTHLTQPTNPPPTATRPPATNPPPATPLPTQPHPTIGPPTQPPPTNPPPTQPPATIDPPHKACKDGIDNDNDGFTDGDDPQCANNGDNDESQ